MDKADIVMTTGPTTHPLGHGWDFYDKMPAGGPDFGGGFDIPAPSPHRLNIVHDISNPPAVVGSNNDSTSPPDLEESNRVMEQHFDFESAANSPGSLERKPTRISPTSAGLDCDALGNGTNGVTIESPARRSRPLSESLSGDVVRHHRHSHWTTSTAAAASSSSLSRSYEASDVNRAIRSMRIQTDGHWPVDESSVPGSMQVSPLATMVTGFSSSSSPTAYFSANPSTPVPGPAAWDDASPLVPPQSDPSRWIEDVDSPATVLGGTLPAHPSNILVRGPVPPSDTLPSPADSRTAPNMRPAIGPMLTIYPMSFKSRVETQVPVTLYLHPMPPGVTKLHLPTHTISKPKFIANPPPPKSPDTLELGVTVVCASSTSEDTLGRVLARAAGDPGIKPDPGAVAAGARHLSSERSPPSNDEGGADSAAADGEDVKICSRCIERERKRAGRRKNWSIEEQEMFNRDEHQRIVVFNTNEIQEWEKLTYSNNTKDAQKPGPPPAVPENAMEVCLPLRIACYCRHHNEKLGFRVIFTLKDYRGALVAQAVTNSIMITDDHKTHTASGSPSTQPQISGGATSPTGVLPPQLPLARHSHGNGESSKAGPMTPGSHAPTAIPKPGGAGDGGNCGSINGRSSNSGATLNLVSPIEARFNDFTVQSPMTATPPFRMSHSSSDLLSLRKGEVPPLNHAAGGTSRERPQQNRPVSFSVRNNSGQSLPSGPAAKKRKPSKEARVPPGLIMTRIDNGLAGSPTAAVPPLTPNTNGAVPPAADLCMDAASLVTSAYAQPVADMSHVLASPEYFSPPAPGVSQHMHFSTGPSTPCHGGFCMPDPRSSYIGSAAFPQAFSAPTSTRHSRAPSPTGIRASAIALQQSQIALQQSQMAQALANGLVGATGLQRRPPVLAIPRIHQVVPAEGPCSGGMEVTCLGEGFCRGMEVMFGDVPATVTRCYHERLLVCRLPPSVHAGDVLVRFRHERQQQLPPQTSPLAIPASSPVTFRYLDNQDQQLMKTALKVIGHQMTGTVEEATDVARRILRENGFPTNGAAPAGASGKNAWSYHHETE